MLARGWLHRQNAARERMQQKEAWRAIDAERQRDTLEEQRRQREAAERRQRVLTETKVRCPCCDTGHVSAELSERVQRALSRLPSGSQPDPDLLARILAGLAPTGTTPAPAMKPAPIALPPVKLDPIAMGTDDAPADDESAIAIYRREEAAREAEIVAMSETVNAAEIAAVEADAQDAVETAAPAPAAAPEPVQTRKHRGRRSAPLPFMADGQ